MKNNAHIFVLFIVVFLISCSNDDDTSEITPPRADGRTAFEIDERSDTYGVCRIESITGFEPVDINGDGINRAC